VSQIYNLIRPNPDRPFLLDLCLTASVICAWFALQGFAPVVAASTKELRLVVQTSAWQLQWPLGPWLISFGGLALCWIRYHFFDADPQRQDRLQRATLLTALLLGLRLAALWPPLTHIFPYLTVLWSPHALWALSLLYLGFLHLPTSKTAESKTTNARTDAYIAGGLLALCLPVYFLYTLYFCQVTMIHGDEGQYLRVTQSLLHDGDMDLANNLDPKQTNEFHVIGFAVHKAPASPEGKVHSVHPIGLSVALLPAYEWGLAHWNNPRLATALFIALLASLCVPLIFLWLSRLGAERWAALLATGLMAVTGPFFYYTNQLFPEIPALLIGLIGLVALSHWQLPDGIYRSWGRWELPALGLLALLLSCLPFFHARYAPLGLFCGTGVLLQAWHSSRRTIALGLIGGIVALAIYALISFHYAFSNDWMGPFRPGNAWKEGALDIATWPLSLPGHWLHMGKGILNSSPIYFFALFGLLLLGRLRDRRLLVVVGLYGATAATNGLHPDWGFGFCFPARFLMTALPVLVLGLAWALPHLLRSAATAFFLALALAISAEGILNTLVLTETGYDGRNLLGRSINHFYPLNLHFFPSGQQDIPFLDFSFWALLVAALFLVRSYFRPEQSAQRLATIAVAALLPFIWGKSDALAARLPHHSLSPYMTRLAPGSKSGETPSLGFEIPLRIYNESARQPDGTILARADITPPTLVNSSLMAIPLLSIPHPGLYQLKFPGLGVSPPNGQVSGHVSVSQGYTVQAVSFWATRSSYPLIGGQVDDDFSIIFQVDRPSIHYIYGEYSGYGDMAMDKIHATFIPGRIPSSISEIQRFEHQDEEANIKAGAQFPNLPRGHYRVRYNISGSTFSSFFDRSPTPIKIAVYAKPDDPDLLQKMAYEWFHTERYQWTTFGSPDYVRPLQEGIHPPWWLSIPFADHTRELRFTLTRDQDVWFLLHYDGPEKLDLTDIVLYQENFQGL
jgi:hypothetical protein